MRDDSAAPVIECQSLAKHYGGAKALDNIDLTLLPGEPIALIGPNGAGKTTLMSLLCGYIKPSAGSVKILGHAPGSTQLSGQLSALPQDALLDPRLNVGRQLIFFARLQGFSSAQAKVEVQRVLDKVGLRESMTTRPSELSHGMRKRIAIAQALIGSPSLVLLDEPTAGIDPPNAKMIRDLVREQSSNTTFMVSSHNLDELERLCGSVIYLEQGRLISYGSIDEDNGDLDSSVLTLRVGKEVPDNFITLSEQLPSVKSVSKTAQGDFLIHTHNDLQASIAVLQLLAENNWNYRQLSRGRSLEERLYGKS